MKLLLVVLGPFLATAGGVMAAPNISDSFRGSVEAYSDVGLLMFFFGVMGAVSGIACAHVFMNLRSWRSWLSKLIVYLLLVILGVPTIFRFALGELGGHGLSGGNITGMLLASFFFCALLALILMPKVKQGIIST